jgi:thiol:disulfide interchange protein DsbD
MKPFVKSLPLLIPVLLTALLTALVAALLAALVAALLAGCGSSVDFTEATRDGGVAMFVAAFLGGMAVCLTPCVYPLIPITVSVFGGLPDAADSPRRRRIRAITTGIAYVLGIAMTYSVLGLLAGLAGKGTVGDHLGSAYVVIPLAVLFAALAASMFGAFDLQLPASWQGRLSSMGGAGLVGGFLMGLVAGLLAAPCTGPVITGILVYIASTQDALLGFWLLFTFSMGLGLMFLVIAAFASALPKSGSWMEGVKSVFGVLMLVAALYYLSSLIDLLSRVRVRETWVLVTGGGLAALGIGVGGVHLDFHDKRMVTWARKLAGVAALTIGLFLAIQYVRGTSVKAQYNDVDSCLKAGREAKRPILMDFWATWCEKCIELEKTTLAHKSVAKVLKRRFVFCKIDCTKKSAKVKKIKRRFKVGGLPTLVILDSRQKPAKNVVGMVTPKELLKILKKIK